MKFIRYISLLGLFVTSCLQSKSQDQQYTQFYAAPMLLNPAFAGTSIQSRVAMNYRNQWPQLPRAFVSYNFSFDHFFADVKSGVGLNVSHDRAGTGALTYTNVSLQYAYEFNVTRKVSIRPAITVGYGSNFLDIDRLTFGDQLARQDDGVATLDPDRARFQQDPVAYPDFGAGLLIYAEKFWLGASVFHINEPVQSLIGSESVLPRRLSAHGGIRLKLSEVGAFSKRQFIVPAFNYQLQGLFDQLDIGFYYEYDPIVIGLWYRGLPGLKQNANQTINQDAIAVLVGYEINNMQIGYSYDLTVSSLTPNSGGAHELSIIMEFASKKSKKKNKRRVMPCAKF
ncbi:MAG: type IX secretion system membrane protein PorP/SprF [Bacteroidota bacterium]